MEEHPTSDTINLVIKNLILKRTIHIPLYVLLYTTYDYGP